MNQAPHAHQFTVRDYSFFWSISYGDQNEQPNKPERGIFESRAKFSIRKEAEFQRHLAAIVVKHDRASQGLPPLDGPRVPEFRPDAWGSEQLPK